MQNREETQPNNSALEYNNLRPTLFILKTNESTINIKTSQIHIIIQGDKNRVRVQESAGKFKVQGKDNQIQISKSWIACEVEGDNNFFGLHQAEFQLKRHEGVGNFIPGYLGDNPGQAANRRLVMQERMINYRVNTARVNSTTIKKYWPNLIKSNYSS